MSTGDSAHWRGSISDLSRATPEELFTAPLFVVEHGDLPDHFTALTAKNRTASVGKQVAKLFAGVSSVEGALDVYNGGVPEHFDGVHVQRYAQVNTCHRTNKNDLTGEGGATRFTIRRRSFAPATLSDYFDLPDDTTEEAELYANSCLVYTRRPDPVKPSIQEIAEREDLPFPNTAKTWTITVPIGATAVFLNGSGFSDSFYTHETRSWHASDRESNFNRVAKLGRVVSDQFAVFNP